MKKRWIVLFAVLLMSFLLVACQNETTEDEAETSPALKNLDFYVLSDGTYGVKVKEAEALTLEELVIPSTYDGNAVTELADEAFKNCRSLKTVTIPDSVKHIGVNAFVGCDALESMSLPFVGAEMDGETNAHLGYLFGAQWSADNGKAVPESLKEIVVTGGTKIEASAFRHCEHLTSITIPDSVTHIGSFAMQGCSGLSRVSLPFVGKEKNGTTDTHFGYVFGAISQDYNKDHVPETLKEVAITGGEEIPFSSFQACSKIEHIKIGSSVQRICRYAFSGCTSLVSIDFETESQLKEIHMQAFAHCSSLKSIEIPVGVTSIGTLAFLKCKALEYIELPDSLVSIGISPFNECSSLKSVKVGSGLTTLDKLLFYGCSALESITIPNTVTKIELELMLGSDAFTRLYYNGTAAQWKSVQKAESGFFDRVTVYYYSESEPTETGNFWHYVNGVPTAW